MAADGSGQLVVNASRSRTLLLIAAALAFVVAGFWMAGLVGDGPSLFQGRSRPLVVVLGWASVVVFGLALVFLVRRLFDPKPALVLDAQGLVDRSSASAVGRVDWAEVTEIAAQGEGPNRLIVIDVADREDLLARLPSGRRKLVQASKGVTGYPVNIPVAGLSLPEDDLLAAMRRFRDAAAR